MDSNRIYSSIARFYDSALWLSGYTLAIKHFVSRIPLDKQSSLSVLDAGCGTGLYSMAVLERFPRSRVTAFDLNLDMVKSFRSRLLKQKDLARRVKLFTANMIHPLPGVTESFNLIITGGVLEYVDIERAAVNLSRYLETGGYFLNTSVKNNIFGRLVGKLYGFAPYSRQRNLDAFLNNGFDLIKVMRFPLTREAYLFKKSG